MMKKNLRDFTDFEPSLFRRTPEGYLTGRIRVTGAGVFSYRGDGGTLRRLRPVKEVGDAASFGTLNGKPVTLLHPSDDVTPDNARNLSVGFSGTDAEWDGLNAYVTITVTDRKAIDAIECGDVEAVSCGYSADISREGGNWQGSEYDEVMSCIRYNHIALVKAGRAGDGVKFRIGDNADEDFEGFYEKQTTGETKMVKHFLDGAVFEVDEKVHEALNAAEKNATEWEAKFKDQADEIERLKAQVDTKDAEIKKMRDSAIDEKAIDARVEEKMAVVSFAKENGVEFKDGMTTGEIKVAIVEKVSGLSLEGKSEIYRDAAYDSAVAMASRSKKEPKASASPLSCHFQDSAVNDPEKAYMAMKNKTFNIKEAK